MEAALLDSAVGDPRWRPPHPPGDPRHPPVKARRGHFDHVRVGTRAFSAANAFATVRCVLEIWEHYPATGSSGSSEIASTDTSSSFRAPRPTTRGRVRAFSSSAIPPRRRGRRRSAPAWLCENFDVVAHEAGHLILKSIIGNLTASKKTLEYRAHEQSAPPTRGVDRVPALRPRRRTPPREHARTALLTKHARGSERRAAVPRSGARSTPPRSGRHRSQRPRRNTDTHAFSKLFTGGAL